MAQPESTKVRAEAVAVARPGQGQATRGDTQKPQGTTRILSDTMSSGHETADTTTAFVNWEIISPYNFDYFKIPWPNKEKF